MIILIFKPKANRVLVYNEKFEGEKKSEVCEVFEV
jgi:hypothetical protein